MNRPDSSVVAIVICVILVALLSVMLILSPVGDANRPDTADAVDEMTETIEKYFYYYDEAPYEDRLTEYALRGMMAGLDDPYAQYFTAEEYDAMLAADSGDYRGLGISVQEPDELGSTILAVYDDSPAQKAGMQKGDRIISVNGTNVGGMSMDAYAALFSEDDTMADTIEYERDGERYTVTVLRSQVHAPRVETDVLDGNIGYLRITEFTGSVVADVAEALATFRGAKIDEIIIDVRDNPGGGLTEVLGVCDQFVPEGKVLTTIKSRFENAQVYNSNGSETPFDMRAAVLVNGNTASASELFSGALQSYGLATVVGTQTYGKGIVQSYFRMKTTGGWIKMTTDAYFTPSDVCIQGVGIAPDIVSELPAELAATPVELIPRADDVQLQAAMRIFLEQMRFAA